MADFRIETDSLGEVRVPAGCGAPRRNARSSLSASGIAADDADALPVGRTMKTAADHFAKTLAAVGDAKKQKQE